MRELISSCILWGKRLHDKSLVTARSGNLSVRAGTDRFLITATGTYLFDLSPEDLVTIDANGTAIGGTKKPSSERAMHAAVYAAFGDEVGAVIHAHSPYTVAFFDKHEDLFCTSFEAELYLGDVPVVEQDSPTVMDVDAVIDALRRNKIVVLGRHGVIAAGRDFAECYSLVELLEEQAKLNIAVGSDDAYSDAYRGGLDVTVLEPGDLFAPRHCAELLRVLAGDSVLAETVADRNVTLSCAFVFGDKGIKVAFNDGVLTTVTADTDADIVFSLAPSRAAPVFTGALDPLVAYTQGRACLTRGDFETLSRHYQTLHGVCELFKCFDIADA